MRFLGEVVTQWADDGRSMILVKDFGFIDSRGNEHISRRGDIINGASIPRFAWITTGSPFVGRYRRAAVLHDSGYLWQRFPRKVVDKMFYDAMRLDGVGKLKAWKMYWAVRKFGRGAWDDDGGLYWILRQLR